MKRQHISTEIYEELRNRIVTWQIQPGEHLTEEELSEEFDVSRTPVREALMLLIHSQYVVHSKRRGYIVRALSLSELEQLYTVRVSLEDLALSLAAKRASFDELKELERRAVRDANSDDHENAMREQFHAAIAAFSGNEPLIQMLESVNDKIYSYRRIDLFEPTRAQEAKEEHVIIIRYLIEGNVGEAQEAMGKHIESSQKVIRRLIDAGVAGLSFNHETSSAPR